MAAPTDLQLSQPVVRIALCAYLDLQGEPLRYALSPVASLTMPGSTLLDIADPDFDGQTFTALDPRFISVSPIRSGPGGSERVEFTVSGDLDLDTGVIAALSDPVRFRGRVAKVWLVLLNDAFAPIAADVGYVGFMAVPNYALAAAASRITIIAENYLALSAGGAPARTLLSQSLYDPADQSAAATLGKGDGGGLGGVPYGFGDFGGLIGPFWQQ
jgi:hypothetical protein